MLRCSLQLGTPLIHALVNHRSFVFVYHIGTRKYVGIHGHCFGVTSGSFCCGCRSSGNATPTGVFSLFYGLHPTYWATVKANNAAIDNPVLIRPAPGPTQCGSRRNG